MQDEMRTFVAVVDAGSLAVAARVLNLTPSAVSKQLKRLEVELQVTLLHRTTRQLRLTDEGRRFHTHAARLVSGYADARADMQQTHAALSGTLRITAPQLFGQERIAPLVAQFLRTAPAMRIELDLSDRYVDMLREPVDIAVRLAPRLPASTLSAHKLATMRWFFVASPDYIHARRMPTAPAELSSHACLELAHAVDRGRWQVAGQRTVAVRGPFLSNNIVAIYKATLGGAGIAQLPAYLVAEDLKRKQLVRILPRHEGQRRQVYALFLGGRAAPRRVRAFVDFLSSAMPREL
jgi:DNA-binding transcriptional LysR family regulator